MTFMLVFRETNKLTDSLLLQRTPGIDQGVFEPLDIWTGQGLVRGLSCRMMPWRMRISTSKTISTTALRADDEIDGISNSISGVYKKSAGDRYLQLRKQQSADRYKHQFLAQYIINRCSISWWAGALKYLFRTRKHASAADFALDTRKLRATRSIWPMSLSWLRSWNALHILTMD